MTDLEMVRNPSEAENKQPKPDPLTDDEVDSILGDLYDIDREGSSVRWTSRAPHDYAAARIPELLEHDRHYTFEVGGVLYAFPHSGEEVPTPAVAALPADEYFRIVRRGGGRSALHPRSR